MRNSARFPHLMQAPLFRDLPEEFAVRFLDDCAVQAHSGPAMVLAQGDPVPGMFLIAQGSVEITCANGDGRAVMIHVARQGETFGEVEALSGEPCAATCTAAAATALLFCARPQLADSTGSAPFLRNLMHVFYQRLVRDNATKFVDQFYPVDQRLRDYLHRLSVDTPEITKTQADLAGLLGCARQTLNRELGRLRDGNIIEIEKGRIRVTDRAALIGPNAALPRLN